MRDIDRECIRLAREADGELALLSVVGSRGYGTNHAGSDHDYKGVYIASNARMFSTRGSQRTIDINLDAKTDVVLYELAHFIKLSVAANPTVLEILWAPSAYVPTMRGFGLQMNRHLFVSQLIYKTYGGYAVAQAKKAIDGTGGTRGADHHKRTKFRLHTLRLIDAGTHALLTGEIPVRVADPTELLLEATRLSNPNDFRAEVDRRMQAMTEAMEVTMLPETVNLDAVDSLVLQLRGIS